jgi:hypothetical protein
MPRRSAISFGPAGFQPTGWRAICWSICAGLVRVKKMVSAQRFVIGSGKASVDWLFPRRANRGAANPGANRPMFGSSLPVADRHLHERLHAGLSCAAGKGSANHGPERIRW